MAKYKLETEIFVFSLVWLLFWFYITSNVFTKIINQNPDRFALPIWWGLYHIPYHLSIFGLIYAIVGKFDVSFRLWIGTFLITTAIFEILIPPLCITENGNILVNNEDYSCYAGNDTTLAWLWVKTGLVNFGNPILRFLVYVVSTIVMIFIGVLILTKKELKDVFKGYFGG